MKTYREIWEKGGLFIMEDHTRTIYEKLPTSVNWKNASITTGIATKRRNDKLSSRNFELVQKPKDEV